jgi:prepilin-type N-terminal cleavage/methylation domain-containing protein
MKTGAFRCSDAFSLIELLVVMGVLTLLASAVVPVVGHLGTGNMQTAQTRAQGVLEAARQFAQAKATYVRVGIAEISGDLPGASSVSIQCIHSQTGDLRNDDETGMANLSYWSSSAKPVVLDGIKLDLSLVGKLATSSASVEPLLKKFPQFTRIGPGGKNVHYEYIIQFDPQGQVSLEPDKLTRSAMFGLVNPRQPSNPVVILMSGLSGRIQALRQEDLTL